MKAKGKLFLGLLLAGTLAALALCGCMGIGYEGSRWGSESGLSMEYTRFHGADSQRLELKAGDTLRADIVSLHGSLKVTLRREDGGETLYEGENLPSCTFEIAIPESGAYELLLEGRRARGSVDFQRRKA